VGAEQWELRRDGIGRRSRHKSEKESERPASGPYAKKSSAPQNYESQWLERRFILMVGWDMRQRPEARVVAQFEISPYPQGVILNGLQAVKDLA